MAKHLPPLGWLRTFECAGRHLSFTLAAEELRMTQSAVSQQIRSLEARLGCPLFVRKHRSIALTDEGRRLLPDISQGIHQLHAATDAFNPTDATESLTIATSVSVAQWYLVPRLENFIAQYPQAKLRLMTSIWPDEFAHTSADVHIRFGAKDGGRFKEKPLGNNQLVVVASPVLIKSRKTARLTAKNVGSFSLIQAVGTSDTWANCAQHFDLENTNHNAAISVDSHGLAVDFAKAGAGVALTSELIAAPSLKDGSLKRLHKRSVPATDGYYISTSSNASKPLTQPFVDWLMAQVTQ